jgi:Uncharacterized protein conserved in bacteria (DUF2188)
LPKGWHRKKGCDATAGRFCFRIIEERDGCWSCRRGAGQIDSHASLAEAIEHLTAVAGEHRPSEVRVHHLDGRVRSVATLD